KIKRAGTADIMGAEMLEFGLELRIGLGPVPLVLQVEDQRHQRFGHESAAEYAETAVFVRARFKRIQFGRLVHLFSPANSCFPALPACASAMARKNASIRFKSLTPGALSTPEDISTALAPVRARAAPILPAFNPPESM